MRRIPICCRCNGSGRCLNCSFPRSRNHCSDCLPIRRGHCCNIDNHQGANGDGSDSTAVQEEHNPTDSVPVSILAVPDTQDTPGATLDGQNLEYVEDIQDSSNILPSFTAVQEPNFKWGEVDGAALTEVINHAYKETVHWRGNLLKVPSGEVGKAFVSEMGHLYHAYAQNSPLEEIALKCVMTMTALLLQKPHRSAKTKEHSICLECRVTSWKHGDIDALHEGCTIQNQLPLQRKVRSTGSFANLMFMSNIRVAIRLLRDHSRGGRLSLDSCVPGGAGESRTVREVLMEKHPEAQSLKMSVVINEEYSTKRLPILSYMNRLMAF